MIRLNENQKRAVETIDKNVLVKAGAGAGKTAVLTERFINILEKQETIKDKESIIAITFTNKAVDEMKSRVIKRVFDENIDFDFNLNIFTFDSFFKKIVDKYESEKYIGFRMLEEYESKEILNNIVKSMYEENENYKNVFDTIQMLNDSYDLKSSIDDIVYLYDRTRNIYGDMNFRKLKTPYGKIIDMRIRDIVNLSREFYSRKNNLWNYIDDNFTDRNHDDILDIEEIIQLIEITNKQEIILELQNQSSILDLMYKDLYDQIKEILDLIDYRYSVIKNKMFAYDFTDITLEATRCMIQNIDEMRQSYKYIMIDEFQDTSPLQMKFFKILTDDFNINNIFVVGDVKQSIYRFRGADYKNIINFEKEIAKNGGEIIELNTNYRSSYNLIDFTNKSFESLLPNYNEMNCGKEIDTEKCIFDFPKTELNEDNVLALINKLLSSGYKYSDIGILSAKKNSSNDLIKIFSNNNIPYINHNSDIIIDRPEIIELMLILKFMIEPDDRLNTLSALRGLLFELSDKSISENLCDNSFLDLNSTDDEIQSAKKLYNDLYEKFINNDIEDFLNYLFVEKEFFAKCKNMWGIEAANNLLVIKNYLIKLVQIEQKSLKYAIIELQRDDNIECSNLYSKNENAIHISTIHKSKGLEYKVVILTDLANKRSSTYPKFIIDDDTLYIKLEKNVGSYQIALRKEKFELNEETKRLLYVALTRAKEKLIIISEDKITDSMMLRSIRDIYDEFKQEINFENAMYKSNDLKIKKQFESLVQIGTISSCKNPSELDDKIERDTTFGDFIHHLAENYDKNININDLISHYNIDEYYDYEKINRHINNLIRFLDSRIFEAYKEKSISMSIGGNDIDAVIDRLEICDDVINIIDFKTVEVNKNNIADYNNIYSSQLYEYKNIISSIYKGSNIKTFIFYTAIGRLEEILWCTKFWL